MRCKLQSGRRHIFSRPRIIGVFAMDTLESRCLMSGGEVVATPIAPILANIANPGANSVTLNQHFNDTTLPGTLATFSTSFGSIQAALSDAATPQTVANFLDYVNSGAYSNTLFHRSVDINTGLGGTPQAPATIIQGGGYSLASGSVNHIPVNPPVADEYTTELSGNVAGTLAMAKTSQANSATSEFYFNVTDNTVLDPPTVDSNGVATSYTVFGTVLSGADVISTIAKSPTYALGNGLDTVPVTGITEAEAQAGAPINANNLIFTTGVTTQPGTNYTVTSSNKTLVTPVVTNGVLSFTYSPTLFGTAEITITGSNLDGTSATTSLYVTVPNQATPNAGAVATDFTAPFTQTGTTGNFFVVANDTDSRAGLDPATITIVTPPAHGTATVDPITGHISYTPATGYVGADSLMYTIADREGNVSNPATVTLDAVPTPVVLTIGVPGARSLAFTQPDGFVGHLSVIGGTAQVTFTDFQVTTKTKGGIVSASGKGCVITNITIANHAADAFLNVSSNGPVQLGSIDDPNTLLFLNAPKATISGTCNIGGINRIIVAAINNAVLNLGGGALVNFFVPSVSNTSVNAVGITSINSKQWLNTNGGNYTITAQNIFVLNCTGTFAENLDLRSTGYGLSFATVATPTGNWGLSGSILRANIQTPGPNWKLSANGVVQNLTVKGNLANSITSAAIGTLKVTGTSTGSTIQTNATFSKKFLQITRVSFGGAVSNTVIFSGGNIGTISAPSITNSRIYAGVLIALAQKGALAKQAGDIEFPARIGAVLLGKGANAFASSLITADIIGVLNLGKINTANGGNEEGIGAHTIGSISGQLPPVGKSKVGVPIKLGPPQLKTAGALAAYITLKKLTLADLKITLF